MSLAKRLLFAILALWVMAFSNLPIQQQDDLGHRVQLAHPAQRIVSLAPHLTEMLFAIGAGAQVVGVVNYSDYPASAQQLPQVGRSDKLDIEAILALQPDLVVAWASGNSPRQLAQLRQLGIAVYVNRPRKMLDIPATMERLGRLTGHGGAARQQAGKLRQRHRSVLERYASKRKVRVFYQIWDQPLMTLNGQHIFNDLLHSCGAVNVFADLPILAPQVSTEAVLSRDPEMILLNARPEGGKLIHNWEHWPQIEAVKNGNLFYINADLIKRSGPRLFDGEEQVCTMVDEARQKRERDAKH